MGKINPRIRPSAMGRVLACPPSIVLDHEEQPPSSYAIEGSACHALAEYYFRYDVQPEALIGKEVEGFTITQEQVEVAQAFIDACEEFKEGEWAPETRYESETLGYGGTIDFCSIYENWAAIVDLKAGAGQKVVAQDNPQLLAYSALLMVEHPQIEFVDCYIVQPRLGGSSSWRVTREMVEEFVKSLAQAKQTADRFLQDREGSLIQLGDHCRWCPAKANCPKFGGEAAQSITQAVNRSAIVPLSDFEGHELSELLQLESTVKELFSAAKKEVKTRLERGDQIEGYKLVEGISNRSWRDEEEVASYLKKKRVKKADSHQPAKLKSPAQLEKVIGKEAVKQFTKRAALGPTLAKESDRRPAIESVADMFLD